MTRLSLTDVESLSNHLLEGLDEIALLFMTSQATREEKHLMMAAFMGLAGIVKTLKGATIGAGISES